MLDAVSATVDAAKAMNANFTCLINYGLPGRGKVELSIVHEAGMLLEDMGATVLPGFIAKRTPLSNSLISGRAIQEFQAKFRATAELTLLWKPSRNLLKESNRNA